MKKVLALVLVLAMAATLFVAAPANAIENPVNLLSYTDEKVNSIISEAPWGALDNLNGIAEWAWDGTGGSTNASMFRIINAPAGVNNNVLYGNHAIVIDHTAGTGDKTKNCATNVFWVQRNLPANTQYTFYFWIKAKGAGVNPGMVEVNVCAETDDIETGTYDANKKDLGAIDGRGANGWLCLHDSIAEANADTDPAGNPDDGNNVSNERFMNQAGWALFSYTFTLPEFVVDKVVNDQVIQKTPAAVKLEIKLNAASTVTTYIDGVALVSGTQVPTDEVFYANDMDRDGLKDDVDNDTNGDGIPNSADIDNDGLIPDRDIDVDGDGILNKYDPDIDGDGIRNIFDKDMDNDGLRNAVDPLPMGLLVGNIAR